MDWKDLHSLLARASGLLGAQIFLKQNVATALSEVLGAPVAESALTIKNKVVFLDAHPTLRAEVFLKRTQILELLAQRGLGQHVTDIR